MAEYLRETGRGRVVPGLESTALLEAIRGLREHYQAHQTRTPELARRDFSLDSLVTTHPDLYQPLTG